MEQRHAKALNTMFGKLLEAKRLMCLGIPDDFDFMDATLTKILQSKVTPHLEPYVARNAS